MNYRFSGVLLLVSCLFAAPAFSQGAWTFQRDSGTSSLARINLSSLESEETTAVALERVSALARGPAGELLLIGDETGFSPSTLFSFDPITFALEEIGDLDLPSPPLVRDLTWHSGRLLMVGDVGVPAGLYEIDIATGQASLIAITDEPIFALASLEDRLVGLVRVDDVYGLYEVDPFDATINLLHELPSSALGFANALDAGLDGQLYLLGINSPPITPPIIVHTTSRIDPATGDVEILADAMSIDLILFSGLVVVDDSLAVAVPGPGSVGQVILWTLLLMAGLTLVRHRQ